MSGKEGNGHTAKRLRVGERTMLACTGCKQRKLKCDAQVPKCRNCSKAERECLVEDPATGLHRPRDYIRSLETQANYLEQRVAYLENVLKGSRPDVATDHFSNDAAEQNFDGSPMDSLRPQERFEGRTDWAPNPQSASDVPGADVLSDKVALLCLGAAGREPQYFGPSSALSFSRIASCVMGLPRSMHGSSSQPNTLGGRHSTHHHSHTDADPGLRLSQTFPSPEKMTQLSRAYFGNIHPQYPFLHRPTVRAMEQECQEAYLSDDLSQVDDVTVFFLLMIYAIGSLALGKEEVDNAEIYYTLALEYMGHMLEMDNLQSIQAILCCAVYSIRSPIGISLWKLSGMAIRHCVELGYHRSTRKYRSTADAITQEMSKRCFWVAYDIDRVASFILGRPVGIADSAIDVELPADIDDESITLEGLTSEPRSSPTEPPTGMTASLHATKLRQLWSQFSDSIYSNFLHSGSDVPPHQVGASIENLRQKLEDWKNSVPDNTYDETLHGKTLSVFASKNWFRLAYDYSILLLYRHYIIDNEGWYQNAPSPSQIDIMDARDRAFEVCADHARDICLIYRHLYQTKGAQVQFTWGSLHILFLAGLTYLYCLWRSPCVRLKTKPNTVMNTSMACTTVLIIIADRWPSAISYRDIFETLSERTLTMMCSEHGKPPENTQLFPQAGRVGPGAMDVAPQPGPSNGTGMDGFSAGVADGFTAFRAENGGVPVQEWMTALDDIEAPVDSQWLAQELFQGLIGDSMFTM